jgi:hypothetical protein
LIDKGLLDTNTAITGQTNRNSEKARSRMGQVLRGSVSTGAEEDTSSIGRVWTAGIRHVTARSRLECGWKLMNGLFLSCSIFFGSRWTADTELVNMGAHLELGAWGSSEMSPLICQITWPHSPEYFNFPFQLVSSNFAEIKWPERVQRFWRKCRRKELFQQAICNFMFLELRTFTLVNNVIRYLPSFLRSTYISS